MSRAVKGAAKAKLAEPFVPQYRIAPTPIGVKETYPADALRFVQWDEGDCVIESDARTVIRVVSRPPIHPVHIENDDLAEGARSRESAAWHLTAEQSEPAFGFSVERPEFASFHVQFRQEYQFKANAFCFDQNLEYPELRAFFIGVAALREQMQAAGFDV